ncbi:hypothetical protein [Parasulfitobacter algicola]|uniref:Replication initiation factor n=1 Tax=Parasulfitobacter algicola TaxID=2614809 RepID=A0ABX2IZU7_9RHOB|nr:hypothetical protein [Sulfitobacter algicola]NSX56331.1 hypothetical protein [Sulfitobacter algicola]
MIVAPPSGNTSEPNDLTVLHKGFDTLALAVKANIPNNLFDYLETERNIAEQDRRDVLVSYNGIDLLLAPHGGNGYRFIARGGNDGATWFFKKPNVKDPWGIRLSFGSFFMATHGLGAAKAHVDHVLDRLGIRFVPNDISISRADFCVDVLAPSFELNPDHFVMHSAAGRRDHVTSDDVVAHGKSGRVTSVTIGGSQNRQVIIYDKRAEVIAHKKSYWWAIWNHTLRKNSEISSPYVTLHKPLSPDPNSAGENRVWRVEFRAGKDLLKDRWGIRTWTQFFDQFGDLCRESGEVVRYTEPLPSDPNRARWPNHPLWETVCAEMNDDLTELRSGADPNPIKEVHREEHIGLLFRNLLGSSITLAALSNAKTEELSTVFQRLSADMTSEVTANPERAAKQLQNAKDRYVFIRRSDEVEG